jgi:hypothetical protein
MGDGFGPDAGSAGAGGAAFLRRQDVLVHLDDQGQQDYMGYRVRILQPNALELGNIAITWNPAAGAPVVHAIRIYREGEVIDVLKTANFEVLRREDQLEAARLDGMLTAVLRVGDLRVGDELEVSYTTRIKDPTLGNMDSGSLFVGASPSPGRYHIGLSWDEGAKPNLKMTPDMTLLAQTSERAVDFRLDNPRPRTRPRMRPCGSSGSGSWNSATLPIGRRFHSAWRRFSPRRRGCRPIRR